MTNCTLTKSKQIRKEWRDGRKRVSNLHVPIPIVFHSIGDAHREACGRSEGIFRLSDHPDRTRLSRHESTGADRDQLDGVAFQVLFPQLPEPLKNSIDFFKQLTASQVVTKLTLKNLAICFARNLIDTSAISDTSQISQYSDM
jgi:hypothetical protein